MLLELKNIGKVYESNGIYTIGLRKVNLSFNYNEFVVIEGCSGAGKSTLLNIIGANDTYEEGELIFNNISTTRYSDSDWDEYRENISFIFQEYNIIENLTVLENVMIALLKISNKKDRTNKALEIIEKVGLTKQINKKGSKLSGGEKQRCVIARAIAKNSSIILADEPTGNLDVKSSKEIAKLLKEISREKLVIIVTHNPEFFDFYATRKITVNDGEITSDSIKESSNKANNFNSFDYRTSFTKWQNTKNLFYLASLNYKSRPKFSIMLSLIFVICAITFLFLVSIFQTNFIAPITQKVKQNPISGKVIISKDNKQIHIKGYEKMMEQINLKSNKGKIKYHIFDETLTDFTINHPATNVDDTETIKLNVLFQPYKYLLKDDEAILKIPIANSRSIPFIKHSLKSLNLNINNIKIIKTISNEKTYLYLSESMVKNYGKLVKATYSTIRIIEEDIRVFSFIKNETLADGTVKLININRYGIDSKKITLSFNHSQTYEIISSSDKDNSGLTKVALSQKDFDKLFTENTFSSQIALYFPSDFVAKKVMPKLNEQGLLTILSTSSNYTDASAKIYQTNLLVYLILFISILFFAFLISLIFIKSVKIYNYDFAIYKTLAISQKTIKHSLLVQMFYIFIPQLFILPFISLIIAIIPNSPFPFISFFNFLIIEIITLLIMLLVYFFFTKKLSKGTINTKIKGGGL